MKGKDSNILIIGRFFLYICGIAFTTRMRLKTLCLMFAALLVPCVIAAAAAGGNIVQQYVDSTLKADPRLRNAAVSLLAVDSRGRTVAQWNPDQPLLPASTLKTVTTGAALLQLGPDFRFETRLAVAGDVDSTGTLHGDIYIVGGGDPTLASETAVGQSRDSLFALWTDALRRSGITAIEGRTVGDECIYSCDIIPENWSWNNIGTGFGSGPCGLSFADNCSRFLVRPGLSEGDSLSITAVDALCRGMTIENAARTGAPGSGDRLAYYASDLSAAGRFCGTYAVDRKTDTIAVSNKFPALTLAESFCRHLCDEGIPCAGSAVGAAPDSAACILEVKSPPLLEICRETNFQSNNFYAESIFMALGVALCGEASYSTAAKAVEEYLKSLGCDTCGLRQDDGSGLSRQNYLSPRFFCNYYKLMQKSAIFAEYLSTLPTPGSDGTLKYLLGKEPYSLRRRIRCKSGSLSAVRCYAGYVESAGGEMLRFAIMVNNYDCPTGRIQPEIEGFLKHLALYE